ncbi:MAG: hypothetical protein KC731_42825 [Myxococcales bacterium]|nr:hypothetical protein [Myxococcales bacterium]
MAVATRMTVDEIGVALAIYTELHAADERAIRRHLDPTPQACFNEAMVWVKSNAKVVRLLRSDPAAIAAQSYVLSPARSWVARVLGLGKPKGVIAPDDAELASVMKDLQKAKASPKKPKRSDHDDLRALVDDAFDAS